MSLLNRFKTAFSGVDQGADEPSGLVEDQSGVVYYIKPDGSRVEVGGGGGALPAGLTWDPVANILGVGDDENGVSTLIPLGLGQQIFLEGADGDATHQGGEVTVGAGDSPGSGGNIAINGGTGGDDVGGSISLASGQSTAWNGGDINIRANPSGAAGHDGGAVNVIAGSGTNQGGSVIVQGGSPDGNVQMYAGDANQAVQLDNNGLHILATKLGFYGSAPVVQPGVPVTLGDVIAALQALGLVAT